MCCCFACTYQQHGHDRACYDLLLLIFCVNFLTSTFMVMIVPCYDILLLML
jgi:hypothetical protein